MKLQMKGANIICNDFSLLLTQLYWHILIFVLFRSISFCSFYLFYSCRCWYRTKLSLQVSPPPPASLTSSLTSSTSAHPSHPSHPRLPGLISLCPPFELLKDASGKSVRSIRDPWLEAVQQAVGGLDAVASALIAMVRDSLASSHCRSAYQGVHGETTGSTVPPIRLRTSMQTPLQTGALLHGRAGTGKSALAHAWSAASGLPTVHLDAGSVFQSEVGASEAALKASFEQAEKLAPSIIIIDDVDIIAGTRGGRAAENAASTVGVLEDRVCTALLNHIDRLNNRQCTKGQRQEATSSAPAPVFLLCISSQPEQLDQSLTAPTRLGLVLEVRGC